MRQTGGRALGDPGFLGSSIPANGAATGAGCLLGQGSPSAVLIKEGEADGQWH